MDFSAAQVRYTNKPGVGNTSQAKSAIAIPISVSKNVQILDGVCKDFQDQSTRQPGLGVQELSRHHCWDAVYSNVDQAALHDAHMKMPALVSICADRGIVLHPRPEKTVARIQEKHAIAQAALPRIGYIDDFKVVSDFMAGRVHCQVGDIASIVDKLKQLAIDRGGWCVVRGEGGDTYGAHKKDSAFKDIVQYAYMYLPEMGHVAEFQIGHEMAAITFTVDSILRDQRKQPSAHVLPIDLWGSKEQGTQLYGAVKDYLLLQANQPESPDLVAKRQECFAVAGRLFANAPIPAEVQRVLDAL